MRDGTLTDAGELLLDYATRLLRLADGRRAVAELRAVRKGRVLIGANEGGIRGPAADRDVPAETSRHPRRCDASSRQMAQEIMLRAVDWRTRVQSTGSGAATLLLGTDELVLWCRRRILADRRQITWRVGRQPVIAHNDPSPARERVLRL